MCANKGTSGIDGVTLKGLSGYIKENWSNIENEIRVRKYVPQAVKRVEIAKSNGGIRKLGIPTVMDRVIQQAMVQILSPVFEPHFSEYSYGFRPKRSCETATLKLLEYLNEGYTWIVDIDLEKFFDNVPQDKLMSYVHEIIKDGNVESLIRKYLKAGILNGNKLEKSEIGLPQGGNISPLLSGIMLTKLDKELESRGLKFVRYADDVVIAVRSESSAKRVMKSIIRWLEENLSLKVNESKSKVTTPDKLKYLGFGFYCNYKSGEWKSKPHKESIKKFKEKLKELTKRSWSINLKERIIKLNLVIRGWINYFSIGSMKRELSRIDSHLRTRIRVAIWKQWKIASKRQWGLQKLGISKDLARQTSYMGNHYQWIVTKTCVLRAISKDVLSRKGLISCLDYYLTRHDLKLKRTATCGTA